ncbi:MAG: hypothetical protein COB08_000730 [Rhodobacteraceae bacterium]|nr:hypothetical protein [Paracoccaceae bacterium]
MGDEADICLIKALPPGQCQVQIVGRSLILSVSAVKGVAQKHWWRHYLKFELSDIEKAEVIGCEHLACMDSLEGSVFLEVNGSAV